MFIRRVSQKLSHTCGGKARGGGGRSKSFGGSAAARFYMTIGSHYYYCITTASLSSLRPHLPPPSSAAPSSSCPSSANPACPPDDRRCLTRTQDAAHDFDNGPPVELKEDRRPSALMLSICARYCWAFERHAPVHLFGRHERATCRLADGASRPDCALRAHYFTFCPASLRNVIWRALSSSLVRLPCSVWPSLLLARSLARSL